MASSVLAQPRSGRYRRIANPLHTLVVLAAEGAIAFRGATSAEQMRIAVNPDRIRMYERTILTEWVVFAFVVLGVWLAGSPLATVVGERWRSLRDVLRDVGIGVAFSIVSTILLSVLDPRGHGSQDRAVRFLLPHGQVEIMLWIALSITAGICEETLYRGYLQRQFMAFTNNTPAGILLAGAAFGLAHSYQGLHWAVVIGIEGVLLGALAYWRKSVRPGMIAHAWKDALAPLFMALPRH
jgi:uncharacterized protein